MENKLEHSNLISPEVEGMQEERMEKSLRPQTLDEYIGQTKVKENMRIYIEAAKKRGEPLDHCLFYGPPGLGKTTIANIIANEMKSNIKITSGPAIEKPGDLVSLSASTVKQDKNISALEDDLYGQTRKIDVILGEVDNINAQKMYRTELIVEGVNIFKTKGEKSTMLCKVYSWDKDITESIDAECFIWHRKSSDEEADTEWDKNHIGMKQITITTEDVLDNASFYCEIKL